MLGNQLKDIRVNFLKLSQRELSEEIGMTRAMISFYETGDKKIPDSKARVFLRLKEQSIRDTEVLELTISQLQAIVDQRIKRIILSRN